MLAAVQFHVQFRLLANEIEMVNADGMLAGVGDVDHEVNLRNGGRTEKFFLTLALDLTFSHGEKEQQSHVFGLRMSYR